jgi:hypothetical protein
MELITTLPSKERFHALIGSLVIARDIIIVGGRGTRGIGRACVLKLFEDDLGNCLVHGDSRATEFPFAEVVASCIVVVVLYCALLQGEVVGMALAGEVMAVSMAVATSIGTGVRHLIPEEAMVAGNSAPTRCRDRTEMVGRFALGGEMVVPRAIRAALALFEFLLGQGFICGVLAVPGDSATRPSS